MSTPHEHRKHEVSFCADVKSWAESLIARHPEWPFGDVTIEEYGKGNSKRQDLRIIDKHSRTPLLSGEAKMPGTPEGRSPYDPALMQDAHNKADNIQSKFFFTWNVNKFVLFDRSQWQRPMIDRRVKEWDLGIGLTTSGQCVLPEIQAKIRDEFLPRFLAEFAAIVSGQKPDWGMPADEIFIRSLESHLDWPIQGTRDYLAESCRGNKAFAERFQSWLSEEMQWTFDPENDDDWRNILHRAASTLCYIFSNRAIFYDAIRAKYPDDLSKLEMPPTGWNEHRVYRQFRKYFEKAVQVSGDYEPVFYPDVDDWAGALVFASPHSSEGWKGLLANLDQYNFREIPHDVVGGIFQKLIAPEERQKFGQYFTHEDIVDVINAFCIRRAGDVVLDPSCGSGSFLVRAYHRKAWLSERKRGGRRMQDHSKSHQDLLREIFGCDIALFPAHLATLNLASRQILDEENYPLIRRGNFFEVAENTEAFCRIPVSAGNGERVPQDIAMPVLDAVIGNPPYVRQELVPRRANLRKMAGETKASFESRLKNSKEHLQSLVQEFWSGLKLSGRSDLHCYFWPIAAKFLNEGGYFGFLTSSSWLDVEYGFELQAWILKNFKLIAVMESLDEPWFEDARVKTCVTILQRCTAPELRENNTVRFVRFNKPLKEILGERKAGDETSRQDAANELRVHIEKRTGDYSDDQLRIVCIRQGDLWEEGVQAGKILSVGTGTDNDEEDEPAEEDASPLEEVRNGHGEYVAGKWGRFVRAPDLYFRLMKDYKDRFVRLGEIADIRFGVKSGCDAFFMPRDVTDSILKDVKGGMLWNNVGLMTSCDIKEVRSGKVRIIKAGDNTLHPVERKYLRPEVHSLMAVDRPTIRAKDLNRVVLWVGDKLRDLAGTYVAKYIRWGEKQTFPSKKSKAVPVPERSTCAARSLWYDLTGVEVGTAFWPMAQQYRHIIPANPERLVCNHNLFYLEARQPSAIEPELLTAVLNSTLLALFKTYYGRYAGTEGNLKTEVVDVKLLPVPRIEGVPKKLAAKILTAFRSMQSRSAGHLVEDAFMDCHTIEHVRELAQRPLGKSTELAQADRRQLDEAVLELIGIEDSKQLRKTLDELHLETARHYRQVRIMEVQKQVQRAGGSSRKLTAKDIAASIWDTLPPEETSQPILTELLKEFRATQVVDIPDGLPKALGGKHMFSPAGVDFKQGKEIVHATYSHVEQAALVAILAERGVRGATKVPTAVDDCKTCGKDLQRKIASAASRFEKIAAARSGSDVMRNDIVALLVSWSLHGR